MMDTASLADELRADREEMLGAFLALREAHHSVVNAAASVVATAAAPAAVVASRTAAPPSLTLLTALMTIADPAVSLEPSDAPARALATRLAREAMPGGSADDAYVRDRNRDGGLGGLSDRVANTRALQRAARFLKVWARVSLDDRAIELGDTRTAIYRGAVSKGPDGGFLADVCG